MSRLLRASALCFSAGVFLALLGLEPRGPLLTVSRAVSGIPSSPKFYVGFVLLRPTSLGDALARPAIPLAFAARSYSYSSVLVVVRMAADTVGLAGVSWAEAFASADIRSKIDRIEMVRVEAVSHPAQMIESHPLWDRADEVLIGQPVHHLHPPFPAKLRATVTARIDVAIPQPALIRIAAQRFDAIIESGAFRCIGHGEGRFVWEG